MTSLTLKNLKQNKIDGFDCSYVSDPSQINGTRYPFRPHWDVQYLGDGTMDIFDTPQQALQWIKEWKDIG
jgi:hypothetical protein